MSADANGPQAGNLGAANQKLPLAGLYQDPPVKDNHHLTLTNAQSGNSSHRHDNRLTEADYAILEKSWITREQADSARLYRVDSLEGAQLVGRSGTGNYAGIVFPYVYPEEANPHEYRLRRDNPDLELQPDKTTKEKQKYLSPPGRGNMVYFVPGTSPESLTDTSIPVAVTEGEKKTIALWRLAHDETTQPHFLPVGLSGCWSWKGTIGKQPGPNGERQDVKGPIPDLDLIKWEGRRVNIVFDSNVSSNEDVARARRGLAKELERRGAKVFLVEIPPEPGVNGVDDLLHLWGPEKVLRLFEAASPVYPRNQKPAEIMNSCGFDKLKEGDTAGLEACLRALADCGKTLDPIARVTLREAVTKRLKKLKFGSPGKTVDAALPTAKKEADNHGQGSTIILADPELWPEPVDVAQLLEELVESVKRYVILPAAAAKGIACWILHAHAHDCADISPILALTSPEKRCGKTTILDLLTDLTPRPLPTANVTPAAMFRAVEQYRPTLLIDEADTFLVGRDADPELRGIVNSGHRRRTAVITRCVGDGHEVRTFRTWAPKASGLIGTLPDTTRDRAIEIRMRRKLSDERVRRLRDGDPELLRLCRQAARWTQDNADALRMADPGIPSGLDDRAQDNWRPLLAIADLAGGECPKLMRRAALDLSGGDAAEDASVGVILLTDIRDLFRERDTDRLASADIVAHLAEMEERPWPEWRQAKPITQNGLAKLLKPFGVVPGTVRLLGKTPKGYKLEQFKDAFKRYIPRHPPLSNRHTATTQ